jgi:putative hydrolase of the HAD superfamily
MEKIDTLLFDLGNVLFPFDWDIAIKGFSGELGLPEPEIAKMARSPDYAILFYEFGTGRISAGRFTDRLNALFESRMDAETVSAVWCSIFREDKAMTGLLKKLSKKYRTFILSDTDALHWDHLQKNFHLEGMVRGTILSFRRGSMKSDPGAFRKIVADYKFRPGMTVLIDDLEKNVKSAEATGMHGVLHRSHGQTVLKLKSLGVEP